MMAEGQALRAVRGLAEYATLCPLDLRSAESLYIGFGRFALQCLIAETKPRTVGQCVKGTPPLAFESRGLKFLVRPESEDIGYITPHHKSSVWSWFHPQPNQVVIDIGAHIGFFALLAGRAGCRVYAIEPLKSTFKLLDSNIKLNRLSNVESINVAIGSRFETRRIHTLARFTGLTSFKANPSVQVDRGMAVEEVRIVPLDSIASIQSNQEIHWMLVDTEGWEAEVLEGGRATLARTNRLILEVEVESNGSRCERLLRDAGLSILARAKQSEINEYWLCAPMSHKARDGKRHASSPAGWAVPPPRSSNR